jgi:hypothetical protein
MFILFYLILFLKERVKAQISTFVSTITSDQFNLTTFSDSDIPEGFNELLPYIKFIRDYNKTQALANLKKSSNEFGKGQILKWNKFYKYIDILANITSYLKENDDTENLFDENIWDMWICN